MEGLFFCVPAVTTWSQSCAGGSREGATQKAPGPKFSAPVIAWCFGPTKKGWLSHDILMGKTWISERESQSWGNTFWDISKMTSHLWVPLDHWWIISPPFSHKAWPPWRQDSLAKHAENIKDHRQNEAQFGTPGGWVKSRDSCRMHWIALDLF